MLDLAMKAEPLLDPRDMRRPNLGIISINLATTSAISVQDGKASTQPVTISTKTSRHL